ncbi:MAG TPA: hypothetical protein PKE29_01615 [Phycisphaerales bacterium]|nr:hypothetical protein [Phycisphaerales bacterium]
MSTKAVIVWLFLAVVLGIAVVLLVLRPEGVLAPVQPGQSVAVGTRLLEFSPGDVRRITVESFSDGLLQTIEPAPKGKGPFGADADWLLRTQPISGSHSASRPAEPWPLESARIQGLLRLLAEVRAVAPASGDATLGNKPTRVTIQLREATSTWTLAERTLGGTGLVEIAGPGPGARRAVVRDDLHRVFNDPGPRAWRSTFPLAGITPDASRVRLDSLSHHLAVSKIDGKWNLIEPAAAPGDPAAIQSLIAELGRVQIVDFFDVPSEASAAEVDTPTATIRIEADRRTIEASEPEPTVSTDSVELTIGGAAGSASPTAPPRVFGSINHQRPVLLDGRSVGITVDPAAYVWPAPLRETPANIGGFSLTLVGDANPGASGRAFRRFGTRWVQTLAGGDEAPVSDSERRGVEEVLAFLTGERGASPRDSQPGARPTITFAAPEESRAIGSLRVDGLSGASIESLEILTVGDDRVCVRTGSVWRTYGPGTVPALLSSAAEVARRATPPPTR